MAVYDLSRLKKPDASKPLFCTIAGAVGVGKTTLACGLPKPIVARFEDGTRSIAHLEDVYETPIMTTKSDIMDLIETITKLDDNDFDRRTFIIDSVTSMNLAFEKEVLAESKTNVLAKAMGGYGNAFGAIAKMHQDVVDACYHLMCVKNINIAFIAHTKIERVNPPDSDMYTKFAIDVPDRALVNYDARVDLVGFLHHKIFLKDDATAEGMPAPQKAKTGKKAIGQNGVWLTCHYTPASCGKNRYGITDSLQVNLGGENPLLKYCVQ